jgi:hypothetical protein
MFSKKILLVLQCNNYNNYLSTNKYNYLFGTILHNDLVFHKYHMFLFLQTSFILYAVNLLVYQLVSNVNEMSSIVSNEYSVLLFEYIPRVQTNLYSKYSLNTNYQLLSCQLHEYVMLTWLYTHPWGNICYTNKTQLMF